MNCITKYNPDVFLNENIHAFHITCVLHDSRQSDLMSRLNIQNKKNSKLSQKEEIKLTEIIEKIIQEKHITLWAYNICKDHVHFVLVCDEKESKSVNLYCFSSFSCSFSL